MKMLISLIVDFNVRAKEIGDYEIDVRKREY